MEFERYNFLKCMMLDITDFGEQIIWNDIEQIACPLARTYKRCLFFQAKKMLGWKKKG